MPESFVFDHASESSGTPLDVSVDPYAVSAFSSPAPSLDLVSASGIDVEGAIIAARGDQTRAVQLTVEVTGTSQANLDSNVATLEAKVAELRQEGGTLRRVRTDGTFRTYDVLAADGYEKTFDLTYLLGNLAVCQISLLAQPFVRGTASTLTDHVETTLPYLTWTETTLGGDVPAAVSLDVDNDGTTDIWGVIYGVDTNAAYDVTAATALPFYEAEALTPTGGAATAVGPSGAYGAGSNVVQHTSLPTTPQAILTTQIAATSAHMTHVGTFRVFARVQMPSTNTGSVSLAFEAANGGFRVFTRYPTVTLTVENKAQWLLVDLGVITLAPAPTGASRWQGRLLAWAANIGEDIIVDQFAIMPTHRSGIAQGSFSLPAPTAFTARDSFATSGALNTLTMDAGGAWATSGTSATDFTVSSGAATRSTTGEALYGGRYAVAGTSTITETIVQADVTVSTLGNTVALLGRYIDASNWFQFAFGQASGYPDGNHWYVQPRKRIAGTVTNYVALLDTGVRTTSSPMTLQLRVTSAGMWSVWAGANGTLSLVMMGRDSVLATGGTLASGKVGFYDEGGVAGTRTVDNFVAWSPSPSAAVYAGQTMAFQSTGIIQEDPTGTVWSGVPMFEGDHLKIPAGKAVRVAVRAVPFAEVANGVWLDGDPGDISAKLTVTSRYLSVF